MLFNNKFVYDGPLRNEVSQSVSIMPTYGVDDRTSVSDRSRHLSLHHRFLLHGRTHPGPIRKKLNSNTFTVHRQCHISATCHQ
jgi:hypothetical protein